MGITVSLCIPSMAPGAACQQRFRQGKSGNKNDYNGNAHVNTKKGGFFHGWPPYLCQGMPVASGETVTETGHAMIGAIPSGPDTFLY